MPAEIWTNAMDTSGDDLVERARGGDRKALESLLEGMLPRLRAFVRLKAGRLIRAKESCSDLVQSTCREVIADLDHFEFRDERTFRQWLCEIALRKILDRQRYYLAEKRDAGRERALLVDSSAADSRLLASYVSFCTPSQQAIAHEEIERLEQAFDLLPEHYREVILCARILELSHAEIAQRMGRSEDSVRNLLSRALARLGTLLAGSSDRP